MSAPISLAEARSAPLRQDVIDALEEALREARAGEIIAINLIKIDRVGDFAVVQHGEMPVTRLIGLLTVATHDALERERNDAFGQSKK